MTWSRECVITNMEGRVTAAKQRDTSPADATFQITDTKLHVTVVILSTENDKRLLEKLRTGFKRTIKWNIYSSELTNQTKNNKLDYLIDPKCTKVDLFYCLKIKAI